MVCYDFVCVGAVEHEGKYGSEIGLDAHREALLSHNTRRVLKQPVLLSSNHSNCNDWVAYTSTSLLCSTPLKNADIVYLEQKMDLPQGLLFSSIRRSRLGELSPGEIPWDPEIRFNAMARHLRQPRGSKSVEHMEELRKSDPTISAHGWFSCREIVESARKTRPYLANQAAIIERARKSLAAERKSEQEFQEDSPPTSPWCRQMPHDADPRNSADTVISFLDLGAATKVGKGGEKSPHSPQSVWDTADLHKVAPYPIAAGTAWFSDS